ncbi:hypothetical protein B0187_00920 [Haemophilus paracuniculus]|uniref:Uncharacterized protein n=1 Tax=Haemophilus paracuniculus TaxID=734 RepID=A0A1T0AVB7_9PAST|nr:hypothetical protein [Haemophilus paracuniculus]OOS00887.1 hypothetical protein B0187_00920 [Haemophilus paracuniculus]
MKKQHNESTAVDQRVDQISAAINYSIYQPYLLKRKVFPEGRLITPDRVEKILEDVDIILGKVP